MGSGHPPSHPSLTEREDKDLQQALQKRREEAEALRGQFLSRLRLAWLKAFVVLDLWEPRVLEKGIEFLDELIQFLGDIEYLLATREGLLDVLAELSELPIVGEWAGKLYRDLVRDGSKIVDAKTIWENRSNFCRLAACTVPLAQLGIEDQVRPLLVKLEKELHRLNLGLQVEKHEPKHDDKVTWVPLTREGNIEGVSVYVALHASPHGSESGKLHKEYFFVISAPKEVCGLLTEIDRAFTGLEATRLAQVASDGRRLCMKALRQGLTQEEKTYCFKLLNALWRHKRSLSQHQANTSEPVEQPPDDESMIIGEQAANYPMFEPERTASPEQMVRHGTEPPDEEQILNRAIHAWWQFCKHILKLEVEPNLSFDQRSGRLSWSFSPRPRAAHFDDNGNIIVEDDRPQLSYRIKFIPQGKPGELVDFDAFWCQDSRGGFWQVTGAEHPEIQDLVALPTLAEDADFKELARLFGEWRQRGVQLFFERDRAQVMQLLADMKSRLDERAKEEQFAAEIDRFIRAAWGLDQEGRPTRSVSEQAGKWLRFIKQRLGVTIYPSFDPKEKLYQSPAALHNYEIKNFSPHFNDRPQGSIIGCRRFAFDPKLCKVTVSLGPESSAPQSLRRAKALRDWALKSITGVSPKNAEESRVVEELKNLCWWAFKFEALAHLGLRQFELGEKREHLRKILSSVNKFIRVVDAKWLTKTLAYLRLWADSFDVIILPESFKPGCKFQDLNQEDRKWCRFQFREDLECGAVVAEELGWRWRDEPKAAHEPKLLVSGGPTPTEYHLLERMVKEASCGEEIRSELLSQLEHWPRLFAEAGVGKDPLALQRCVMEWYHTLRGKLSGAIDVSRQQLWQNLKKDFAEKILASVGLRFWNPSAFAEVLKSTARCIAVGNAAPGANDFEILFDGLQDAQGEVVVASIVRLVRT